MELWDAVTETPTARSVTSWVFLIDKEDAVAVVFLRKGGGESGKTIASPVAFDAAR